MPSRRRVQVLRLGACGAAVLAVGVLGLRPTRADEPGPRDAPAATQPAQAPGEDEIRAAIRDLNHPSPARRRDAVGKLADWGPLAFDALRKVADGPDLEPALLAGDLLAEMGEVLFVGGQVRLEVDRNRIAWNEPVMITVRIDNPTPGEVMVPWPAAASSRPTADDATQVGALLDVADQLSVVGPDGAEVDVRVDPVEQDTAVYRAVTVRAGDRPPSHAVPARTGERICLTQFNRGWARYPMLAAGRYTVKFAYQPEWKNPGWIAQGFGLIESNSVVIEVIEPAPVELRRANRPVRLELRVAGDQVIGELENTWDRDLWLNLNIGGPADTHARLDWCPQPSDHEDPDPFMLDADATGPQFAVDRLKKLAPGDRLAVSQAKLAEIRKRMQAHRADPSARSPLITLKYSHIPSAQDLRRALREKGRRESIPGQIFSGAAVSDPVAIP